MSGKLAGVNSEPTGGWLPIESAPKDGTRVLVYRPHDNEYCWHIDVDRQKDGVWRGSPSMCQPSHWMPLPTPLPKGAPVGSAPPSDEGGSRPPSSSDRDAVIEECAVALTSQGFWRDEGGEGAAVIVRSLKSPPTVG